MSGPSQKPVMPRLNRKAKQPAWYSLYFVLAVLDVITVLISFGLNIKLTSNYAESISLNQEWAERLSNYAELAVAAGAVNAPGNDVFDSGDAVAERKRVGDALIIYNAKYEAAYREIQALNMPESSLLLKDFELIQEAMNGMRNEASLIFNFIEAGKALEAGKRMATMDRKFAVLNLRIASLSQRVRAIQQSIFDKQQANAKSLQQLEYFIFALVVLMVIGALFYGRYISIAMKQAEKDRRQMDKMKSEFVSTVSHELRTPLTAIVGALGLIQNKVLGEEVLPKTMKLIDLAQKNSQRLSLLINDLLDLEKFESGKFQFDMQVQLIRPVIDQALEACQSYCTDYGLTIACTSLDVDTRVNVDSSRLTQVLLNLLSNAIKFSPQGGVVEVFIEQREQWIRVSVRDHGQGISPEFQQRIFQKFAQGDASDTRKKGGTGLGLTISRQLMEGMGGHIDFVSVEGQGATFFIDLPVHVAA
jgi:signal transduction histidine kinase